MRPALLTMALILMIGVLLTTKPYGHAGTPNGGILITTPWWQGGAEFWGNPAVFTCDPGVC